MASSDDIPVDPSVDPDIVPPNPYTEPYPTEVNEAGEDRRIVGELVYEEVEPEGPPEPTLTSEDRINLARLLTVGRRSKTINVHGHQVVIQTLKSADEMRIGLYTKDYLDSQGFSRAYQIGVCAAGIQDIKNQPLWTALKEIDDPDEIFKRNVEALLEFYPIVISQIYQAIMDLEREYAELAIKLGKSQG